MRLFLRFGCKIHENYQFWNGLLAWNFFHRFSFKFLLHTQNKRTRVFGFFRKNANFKKKKIEIYDPIQKASFLMVQSAKFKYSRLNISVIIASNLKIWTQFFIIIVYLRSSQWNSKIYFSCKHPIPDLWWHRFVKLT
jgi:hypothetical protein